MNGMRRTTAMAAVLTIVAWPGTAAADPTAATLHYACPPSGLFSQPMTAQIGWDTPGSAVVGQATPPTVAVNVTATVGPMITWALGLNGVTTIAGSVTAPSTVVAPGKNIPTSVQLTVSPTRVPSSGPMTVHATGTLPRFVFQAPGRATMTLDNDMTVQVALRDAHGNPAAGGKLNYACALDPGQNTALFSFAVTSAPVSTTAGTTTSPGTTTNAPGHGSSPTGPGQKPTGPTNNAATRSVGQSVAAVGAEGSAPTSDFWRIASTVIAVAATAVIAGVLWLKRRRRRLPGR